MIKKYIIIIILILSLSGCYNYQELNDISIITAIGIDYQDNKYILSYEAINSNKGSNGSSGDNQSNFTVYTLEDETIETTARKAANTISKRLYASHMEVLILSESVAKNKLKEVIDFMYRNPEVRTEFYVLVAKDNTPREVLEVLTPILNVNSVNIKESLESSNHLMGSSELVTFADLLHNYLNPNTEVVLPSVKITKDNNGDKEETSNNEDGKDTSNLETTKSYSNLEISNMSVFKDNKFKGYLTFDEDITYNIIKNNLKTTIYKYKCATDKYISFELIEVKSKLKAETNGKVNLSISGKANVTEMQCNINFTNPKAINNLKKKVNNSIEKYINNNFKNINNKYNSDIYGIKDYYYKNNTRYYNKISENYYKYFNTIKLNVDSNIEIFGEGNGDEELK